MSHTIRRVVDEDHPETDVGGKAAKKNRRIARARKAFISLRLA